MPIKLIDSVQYHLWSDALHARQLARDTKDEWDRGAYVLGIQGLGMRFRAKGARIRGCRRRLMLT